MSLHVQKILLQSELSECKVEGLLELLCMIFKQWNIIGNHSQNGPNFQELRMNFCNTQASCSPWNIMPTLDSNLSRNFSLISQFILNSSITQLFGSICSLKFITDNRIVVCHHFDGTVVFLWIQRTNSQSPDSWIWRVSWFWKITLFLMSLPSIQTSPYAVCHSFLLAIVSA